MLKWLEIVLQSIRSAMRAQRGAGAQTWSYASYWQYYEIKSNSGDPLLLSERKLELRNLNSTDLLGRVAE